MTRYLLDCRAVTVAYDAAPVLRSIDLAVRPEEVVAVLGPSGSGKTTLLYAIAGFVDLAGGEIAIGGQTVATERAGDPPESRDVGFVFQHYALWPHLSALETVAYPMRRRGLAAGAAAERAQHLLERMGIGHLAARRPAELSGGQQQRVGLARALARGPSLFLFDEPTAHLDTALRVALQEELAEQRRETGAGAVYATHDSGEALAIADRVVLLRDGEIVQTGTAADVYERPVDVWAARLTGPASLLHTEAAESRGELLALRFDGRTVTVAGGGAAPGRGARAALVRPDWATLGGELPGSVDRVWYRGPYTDYRLEIPGGVIEIRAPGRPTASAGEPVGWTLRRVWLVET